jgi:hypothetical protein
MCNIEHVFYVLNSILTDLVKTLYSKPGQQISLHNPPPPPSSESLKTTCTSKYPILIGFCHLEYKTVE